MTNWTDYVPPPSFDSTIDKFRTAVKPSSPPATKPQQQQHQETNNHHSNAGWHPSPQKK